MKQHEAVIKVMENNDGFATLGFLYQNALKIPGVEWKTKTPFASVRRIVQDERFFFKIKPGLWALKSFKNKLPSDITQLLQPTVVRQAEEFNHSYYQGLLVEIGNLKGYQTFVPYQDKNKNFLGKKLGQVSSVSEIFNFGYDNLVKKAQMVDVLWFNVRKMPSKLFEVEHSTDIQNSLLKFMELRDYYVEFFIVADEARKREFEHKISLNAFEPVNKRVKFLDYEKLSEWHSKVYEFISLEKSFG